MPKLNVETSEKEKPIILFAGQSKLTKFLAYKLREEFKIVLISDDNEIHDSDFYRIKPESAHLIKNLEEKIDYAVVFLSNSSERKYISSLFEKLEGDKTRTAIIIGIDRVSEFYDIILEYKKSANLYFLFLGDIYSERFDFADSESRKIITETLGKKSLNLNGNDLRPLFPIYYKDAVEGISQIIFGKERKNRYYYLFYNHPQTYISAVHIIARVEPDLKINYGEAIENVQESVSREQIEKEIVAKTLIKPDYLDRYFTGFEKSLGYFMNRKALEEEEKPTGVTVSGVIKSQKPRAKILSLAVLFAAVLYLVILIIFSGLTLFYFKHSIEQFGKQNYREVFESSNKTTLYFGIVSPALDILSKIARSAGFNSIADSYDSFSQTEYLMSLAARDFTTIQNISRGVSRDDLDRTISDAFYLYFAAENIQNKLKNSNLKTIITPDLPKLLSLSPVTVQILGYDKPKNYLLLLQNNGELRPTGGFIGSVGELRFSSGKVEYLKIQDVYDLDGKLKAHVEPYYVVRRYLQPHLYLRDSNFDPDFQNSASTAALIYNLEANKKVDGVIAINFEAVKKIIGEVGPIKLPAYNKTLDAKNAFDFLESTIDDKFFPGSSQKRDVLNALLNQLLIKLESRDYEIKVAKLIPQLMNEKNILFAFSQNSIQSVFSANNFSGEYKDSRSVDTNTISDYMAINEANIGVNKINAKLSHETSYTVTLGKTFQSKIIHTIINEKGGGDYLVYLRFFVPAGSDLKSIVIDGKQQNIVPAVTDFRKYEDKRFHPPTGLEVDKDIENGKQIFGLITRVSKGKNQIVEVNYENGTKNVTSSTVNYALRVIKQPGVESYPFKLTVSYPPNLTPQEVEGATLSDGNVQMNRKLVSDEDFNVLFVQK